MISTTYGDIRNAVAAINALTQLDLKIKFETVLRWKRILGLLKPLLEQFEELEQEVGQKHMLLDKETGAAIEESPGRYKVKDPLAYNREMKELRQVPLEVGSDQVKLTDFRQDEDVQSALVNILFALGPFLQEAE